MVMGASSVINASMGPRSDERGNKRYPCGRKTEGDRLQWGRARMSAEMQVGMEREKKISLSLQWGRARMSAEISGPNGVLVPICWLQWGRARMSAEILQCCRGENHIIELQWGRARMSAEISSKKNPACGKSSSFNGAALG